MNIGDQPWPDPVGAAGRVRDMQVAGVASGGDGGQPSVARAVWKMPKFPVIQRAVSLSLAIRQPLEVRSNRFV